SRRAGEETKATATRRLRPRSSRERGGKEGGARGNQGCDGEPKRSGGVSRRQQAPESNRRHHGFQPCALPTELPRRARPVYPGAKKRTSRPVRPRRERPRGERGYDGSGLGASSGPLKNSLLARSSGPDADVDRVTRAGRQ